MNEAIGHQKSIKLKLKLLELDQVLVEFFINLIHFR